MGDETNGVAVLKATREGESSPVLQFGDSTTLPTYLTNVAAGKNDTDAVNVSQLNAINKTLTDTINKGLKFTGNDVDTSFKKDLGETLTVKGGFNPSALDKAEEETTDSNTYVTVGKNPDDGSFENNLIIRLARNLTDLTSAEFKNTDGTTTTVNGSGVTIKPSSADANKTVSLTDKGLNNGGNKIENLASAIGGEAMNGDNSFINNLRTVGEPENGITPNAAVTTQDLRNLADTGFKLQTNSGTAQTVKLGDTVQVVDGKNTRVSTITSNNGVHSYAINVDGLPMSFTDKDGNALVKVGDNFYKASDIGAGDTLVKVGDKVYKASDLDDQGQPIDENKALTATTPTSTSLVDSNGKTETPLTLSNVATPTKANDAANKQYVDQAAWTIGSTVKGAEGVTSPSTSVNKDDVVNFSNGTGTTAEVSVVTTDNKDTFTVKYNVNKATLKKGDNGKVEVDKTAGEPDSNSFATAANVAEMINSVNDKLTGSTFGLKAADDKSITQHLGTAITVVGADSNISTKVATVKKEGETTENQLQIELSKDLTGLNSAEFKNTDGSTTTVNGNGVTIQPSTADANKTVSLTDKGLNNGGNKITNVGAGDISENSTDAINGGQLYQYQQATNTAVAQARTQVTGTGAAIVTKTTTDGRDSYNVHVEETMAFTNADGDKLIKGADGKWYKPTDIAGKVYDATSKTWKQVGDDGSLQDLAQQPSAEMIKGADGKWYKPDDIKGLVYNDGAWKKVGEDGSMQEVTPPTATSPSLRLVDAYGGTNNTIKLENLASAIGGKVVDEAMNGDNSFINNLRTVGKPNGITPNAAVTTQDLRNLADTGFKLQTSGSMTANQAATTVKLGDTVQVVDGKNTRVSAITSNKGIHSYAINVDGLPMSFTDDQGNALVKVGDNFYKASDIGAGDTLVKVGNKLYKSSDLNDQGQPKSDATEITASTPAGVSLVDKEGKSTSQQLSGIQSSVADVEIKGTDGQVNQNASFTDKLAQAATDAKRKDNAVNVSDLNEVATAAKNAQATADKGFNVKVSASGTGVASATDDLKENGQFYTVAGVNKDGNIVGKDGSVTSAKDNLVKTNNIIASVQNAEGSVTNPSKLTNVADGAVAKGSKDAINGGQLYEYLGIKEGDDIQITQVTVNKPDGTTIVINVPTDKAGNPYLTTYNVEEQGEHITNNVYTAIRNMNEQGIKYFHVNAGQDIPEKQASNSEDSNASAKYAAAIGYQANVESGAEGGLAIGKGATVTKDSVGSIAIGSGGKVSGKNSISIGSGNIVKGDGPGAFGDPSSVTGDGSYALGNNNTIEANNAFAVGNETKVTADNAVAVGHKTKVTTKNSVALGANAQATQTIEELQSAVPVGDPERVRGYGKQVIGEVSVGGVNEAGEQEVRRITNVAAGSAPTDAVNVSQLEASKYETNKKINRLARDIDKLDKRIDGVAASAAAMANLPQPTAPGKSMVSLGVGSHRSQQAIAIGVSRISDNGKIVIKASATQNTNGNATVGAGVGFQW